jgi:PST family polysaccharide transporter
MNTLIKEYYLYHKETCDNFLWRALQVFSKQGIIFFIFIICAKVLRPYEFGIYNYILALVLFLSMFGDFGISTATSKYIAEYNISDKKKVRAVLFNSGLMIVILSSVTSLAVVLLGPSFLGDQYYYVLFLLPTIFLSPLTSLYDGIYRGLKKFKSLTLISLISGLIALSFVTVLIRYYGLLGAILAQNLFYFLLFISFVFTYKEFSFGLNIKILTEIGKYSVFIGVATTGYYLFSRMSIFILGHYGFFEKIAVYEILNKIFGLIVVPLSILSAVLAPNISVNYSEKNYPELYRKFKRYFVFSIIVSVFSFVTLFVVIPIIVKLFFVKYYTDSFYSLFIPVLGFYTVIIYSFVIDNLIILSSKFAKIDMYLKLFLIILNLPLSIFLMKYLGYLGPIYSVFFLTFIEILFLNIYYFIDIKSKVDK